MGLARAVAAWRLQFLHALISRRIFQIAWLGKPRHPRAKRPARPRSTRPAALLGAPMFPQLPLKL